MGAPWGNPLTYYDGTTFTWEGRQMQSATVGNQTLQFQYNSDGYRTSKTVDGVKTVYVLDGSKVIMEQTGTGTPIYYTYDAAGQPTTMTVGSTTYYYVYNLQGDVIAITNNNGMKVVEYTYDPWGKVLSVTGTLADTIGAQNPYRYRAYRYDTELEMYYLNSRYYDPEIGRFINADDVGVIGTTPWTLTDKNLYAYCDNNPVNRRDSGGYLWETVLDIISLGFSIYDVVSNPSDPLAWLGLAGDIIDVAVPFVAGVGEIVRACKVVDTAAEVIDTSKDAAKIIDNVGETVQVINNTDAVVDIGKIATTGSPNSIGKIGEQLAGINPKAKTPIQVNGRTRIPDGLTATTLTEVKNVKYISNTSQLRDFATFAQNTGRTMDLYVRPNTKVAKTVTDAGWNIKYLW